MQKTFCLAAACPVPQFSRQEEGERGILGAHPCPTVEYKPLGCHPRVPRCEVPPVLGSSGKVLGFDWNGGGLAFGYRRDRVTLGMMRNMDPSGR